MKGTQEGSKKLGEKNRRQHKQEILMKIEKKTWKEKVNLITFIEGEIYATADVKSKTERIEIITKEEVHNLNMMGLKWEEIRDGLSQAEIVKDDYTNLTL